MESTRSTFPAFRSILFALSCFVVMPALAQWRITTVDSTGSAYNPKIVADRLGHLHVSFLDENGLYYTTNSSGAWVSSHLFQGTVASATIAVDRAGHGHLVYVTGSPLRTISYLDHTGAGWSAPQTVVENLDGVVSLTIGVDSAGHAHVGWVTAVSMAGSGPLMYATNASGTWVNETVGGAIQAYNAGALAVTAAADVQFAYYANAGIYHIAKPHGGSWATAEHVDTVASWAEGLTIDLALDDAGKPHIAYAGGPNAYLRHATKPVSTWITETVQPGVYSIAIRAIDVDGSGLSHVSFMDIETGYLRYGTNASGSWTTSPVVPISWMHDIAVDEGGYPHIVYDMEGAIRHVTTRPPASNAFVRVRTGLPKVNFSSAEWGDFDGDGWMDIAITG
ncbi:MAG: hypothetical protein MUF82_09470, partial [Bacteroidetes bacterium]|nr:hypothetical protein [Bacteroidota bacterium]